MDEELKPAQMSFPIWLQTQKDRDDHIGSAARLAQGARGDDLAGLLLNVLAIKTRGAAKDADIAALDEAWRTYCLMIEMARQAQRELDRRAADLRAIINAAFEPRKGEE